MLLQRVGVPELLAALQAGVLGREVDLHVAPQLVLGPEVLVVGADEALVRLLLAVGRLYKILLNLAPYFSSIFSNVFRSTFLRWMHFFFQTV